MGLYDFSNNYKRDGPEKIKPKQTLSEKEVFQVLGVFTELTFIFFLQFNFSLLFTVKKNYTADP